MTNGTIITIIIIFASGGDLDDLCLIWAWSKFNNPKAPCGAAPPSPKFAVQRSWLGSLFCEGQMCSGLCGIRVSAGSRQVLGGFRWFSASSQRFSLVLAVPGGFRYSSQFSTVLGRPLAVFCWDASCGRYWALSVSCSLWWFQALAMSVSCCL